MPKPTHHPKAERSGCRRQGTPVDPQIKDREEGEGGN